MKAALYVVTALAAAAAIAPAGAQSTSSDERVSRVVVYGRDACPRGSGDEIVVCGRRPENERYRIP